MQFKLFNRKIYLVVVIVILAIFIVIAAGLFYKPKITSPPVKTQSSAAQSSTSAADCSAPDQTFCDTQNKMENFVKQNDFSDILEQQAVTHVTCNTPNAPAVACAGVTQQLKVDVFTVIQSGKTEFLSRNAYIGYFDNYANNNGPFNFVEDKTDNNAITMQFADSNGTKILNFLFNKEGNKWVLIEPVTS